MAEISSFSNGFTFGRGSAGYSYTYSDTTSKYLTTYAYGKYATGSAAINRSRLGDAIGEVTLEASTSSGIQTWHGMHFSDFPCISCNEDYGGVGPWFYRSALYAYRGCIGRAEDDITTKAVLVLID